VRTHASIVWRHAGIGEFGEQRVRPIVSDTSKTAKINFINSGAVDIIRTAYYICGLELMKLIFAVLDVSLTTGLTRCYKTEGFSHLSQCIGYA